MHPAYGRLPVCYVQTHCTCTHKRMQMYIHTIIHKWTPGFGDEAPRISLRKFLKSVYALGRYVQTHCTCTHKRMQMYIHTIRHKWTPGFGDEAPRDLLTEVFEIGVRSVMARCVVRVCCRTYLFVISQVCARLCERNACEPAKSLACDANHAQCQTAAARETVDRQQSERIKSECAIIH